MMHFSKPFCPHCGWLADGTLETITGKAGLMWDKDNPQYTLDRTQGLADYNGETKMFWNEQRTVTNKRGLVVMLCPNGHEWGSARKNIKPAKVQA